MRSSLDCRKETKIVLGNLWGDWDLPRGNVFDRLENAVHMGDCVFSNLILANSNILAFRNKNIREVVAGFQS